MIKFLFRLIFFPLRLPVYGYRKLRGKTRINWIQLEISGEYPETPPESGWMQMVKSEKTRFYELSLTLSFLLRKLSLTEKFKNEVKEISVMINQPKLGWARAWEIQSLLKKLTNLGIATRAYLKSSDKTSLFIATGCAYIYAPPAMSFDLSGFHSDSMFFAGTFAKLGIKPQFISIGKFKSAAEMFERKKFSAPAKQQLNELLSSIHSEFQKAVSEKIKKGKKLDSFILSPESAKSLGLIDDILYPTQFEHLINLLHSPKPLKARSINEVNKIISHREMELLFARKRKKVAVLVAEGPIVEATETTPSTINYHDYHAAIENIGESNYDAVVLRINSPGGSALASDMLWQELMNLQSNEPVFDADERLKKYQKEEMKDKPEKKKKKKKEPKKFPLIISQGDVAASGGYYLSALNKHVFSTPMSITGSIGVLAGKFNISGFAEKLGISFDKTSAGKNGEWFSPFASFSAKAKKELTESMKSMYDLFRNRITLGRGMPDKTIRKLGEGRVYSGGHAKKLGLVDHKGGLYHAVEFALKEAGCGPKHDIELSFYPRIKTPLFRKSIAKIPFLRSMQKFSLLNQSKVFFLEPDSLSGFTEDP